MMQVIIKGRNIELTEALRGYAEEKLNKIDRYLDPDTKIEIELSVEKNPSIADNQTIEVTVFANHSSVIRAKQSSPDMYASIDEIVEKLGKRMRKYKDKSDRRHDKHHKETIRGNGVSEEDLAAMAAASEEETEIEPDDMMIVKRKQFSVKPMTPEEAVLEMDLLGHNFFFFTNADTDTPNVIYKRRDGHVGLIEPS